MMDMTLTSSVTIDGVSTWAAESFWRWPAGLSRLLPASCY
jgi:hypothetical protein